LGILILVDKKKLLVEQRSFLVQVTCTEQSRSKLSLL
jgi:hypothetical protein